MFGQAVSFDVTQKNADGTLGSDGTVFEPLVALQGAQCAISMSPAGQITGGGMSLKASVHVPNQSLSQTVAAVCANLHGYGSSSGGSDIALFKGLIDGTPGDLVKADFLNLTGCGAAGAGKMLQVNTATASTHILKCKIEGTAYGIMLVTL